MNCKAQEEYKILDICNACLSSGTLKKGYVLTYDRMRRYEGAWHFEQKILFQECVFLESEDRQSLIEEVRDCSDLRENELLSVNKDEEILLKKLCGETGNLTMSKGIIKSGVPMIIRGPLKGMENQICKINRHKRLARVEAAEHLREMRECSGSMRNGAGYLGNMWNSRGRLIGEWSFPYITAGLEILDKIV